LNKYDSLPEQMAKQYYVWAEECRELAAAAIRSEDQQRWLKLAQSWCDLAEHWIVQAPASESPSPD
jgi:hypothetical protein